MRLKSFSILLFSFFVFAVSAQHLGNFIVSSDVPTERYISGYLGYSVYQLQVQIGENELSGTIPLIQDDGLVVLNTLKTLLNYRVIDAMQHVQNKSETFDVYINSIEAALYSSNAIQNQLQSEIQSVSASIDICESAKNISDKNYADAIEVASPTQQLDPIVNTSQQNSACIANNHVLLSAKQKLLDTLILESNKLGEKYDSLLSQKDIILNHFDLLDSTYLQQVLDVQQNIQDQNY